MKKRHVFFGWIALELAALPAAAYVFQQSDFEWPKITTAVEIGSVPGNKTYMVAAEGPFVILAENTSGAYEVSIEQSGMINGNRFGENAQLPGQPFQCSKVRSKKVVKLYRSNRKTIAAEGDILTRAVRVDIAYDKEMNPKFKIVSEKKARDIPKAPSCETALALR